MSNLIARMTPASSAYPVTLNDSEDNVPPGCKALFVGAEGDVKVDMEGSGSAVVFKGVAAGDILPIRVVRVYDTDTTATDIVALY